MRNVWFAVGKNGKVENWYSAERLNISAPQVEIDINDIKSKTFPKSIRWDGNKKEKNLLRLISAMGAVEKIYRCWKNFGPYGDLIQVHLQSGCLNIDFIGQLAFPKPALAADLSPLIRDAARNLYFVGIKRKKEPGIGKPALIGGHLDIKGYHLETAAEALVHEAKDEAGIKIRVMKQFAHTLKNKPYMSRFPISVGLKNYPKLPSELLLIGTFKTSSEDKLPHLGVKRVYQTTAYTLIVDIYDQAFTPDEIAELFTAGDDAASIYVHKITSLQSPPFAIKHHRTIYRATLAKLLKEQRINIK